MKNQEAKAHYKINANKTQLSSIGINYNLTGLVGLLKSKYPTGWYELEVTHQSNGTTFTNNFDIPKTFLTKILQTMTELKAKAEAEKP